MKNKLISIAAALALSLTLNATTSSAEPGAIAGVDLGFVRPTGPFDDFSDTGGVFSPFLGYMANNYIGGMAQLQVFGTPNQDRPGILDDDATWAFGGLLGPRVALPMGKAELYATFQGGFFTGLAPHSSITDSSGAWSTGGGLNVRVSDKFLIGGFARYNRLYQRVHGEGDVTYVTGGVSLTYNEAAAAPAPPPPPVAQAPAPPPVPVKKKIVLRGVHFDFDKSVIRPQDRPVLDEAIATLKQEGGIAVIAEGHTDSRGTDAYNQKLSERRANAVREYLVAGGISASRIRAEGLGEAKPVASNDTDDGRAQNRRTELQVSGQ